MVQLAPSTSYKHTEINSSINENGDFNLLPGGWLEKYCKLSTMSPWFSKSNGLNEMLARFRTR